jgi:prophage regulatory protein
MNAIQDQFPPERLIRIAEVKKLTGLSAASIYRKIADNKFPRQVSIGTAARAWPLSEIQNWIAKLVSERDSAQRWRTSI